ncbi:MAG: hypothetical protein DMD56_06410 [Gemmatimonadetes bacterium]|nr:MAG: hypothetical protein DMD56_06410 [Gemmatimonadota bacterium]
MERGQRPAPFDARLDGREEQHREPEEHHILNGLGRLQERGELLPAWCESQVEQRLQGDEHNDGDQCPGGDAQEHVRPAQVPKAGHGLARGAEQVARHMLEPRAGEPLRDALPQPLERLHDAGPIEATVHRH